MVEQTNDLVVQDEVIIPLQVPVVEDNSTPVDMVSNILVSQTSRSLDLFSKAGGVLQQFDPTTEALGLGKFSKLFTPQILTAALASVGALVTVNAVKNSYKKLWKPITIGVVALFAFNAMFGVKKNEQIAPKG